MSGLFSRNFDYLEDNFPKSPEETPNEVKSATISLAEAELMVQRARTEGFEKGQIAGASRALSEERASRASKSDNALQILAEHLMDLSSRDLSLRTAVTLEMTELIAGIGERVLPDLFEASIADALMVRTYSAIHTMVGTGNVTIRVPPELFETLCPQLDQLIERIDIQSVQIEVVADEQINDGVIRIDWKNGFLEFDPACASLEILEILKEAILELRSQMENM